MLWTKLSDIGIKLTLNTSPSALQTMEGLSPEIQAMLFDSIRHLTTPGTENEPGTGLGLILCKEFIQKK